MLVVLSNVGCLCITDGKIYELLHTKTNNLGFRTGLTQTDLQAQKMERLEILDYHTISVAKTKVPLFLHM